MPLDMGSLVTGPVMAQPTEKATNLTAHVEGPTGPSNAVSNSTAAVSAKTTMHYAAGIVISAVVLLWLCGAIVFKSVNL